MKAKPKIRMNSFFEEGGSTPSTTKVAAVQRIISSGEAPNVNFFHRQDVAAKLGRVFDQQQQAPIKIKLSKKRRTEDSQVRVSLNQTAILNQTLGNSKMDFQKTTSFRDMFPTANILDRSVRPGQQSKQTSIDFQFADYEAKIEANREKNFIENLI